MKTKKAFTLIEVLISIVLVGLILPPLYKLITLMQDSNSQIFTYVKQNTKESKLIDIMYLDFLSSDGNISISKDEFSRVCINSTHNSLYGFSNVKVCWVVVKTNNTLVRIEGTNYNLPLELDAKVESYSSLNNLELFDVYRNKTDILVIIKQKSQQPIVFEIFGVEQVLNNQKKVNKNKKHIKKDSNITGGKLF